MKHIIKVNVIEGDGFVKVLLDNKKIIKNGYDYSYCEHCHEMANVLKMIFNKIKGDSFEFKVEVEKIEEDEEYYVP